MAREIFFEEKWGNERSGTGIQLRNCRSGASERKPESPLTFLLRRLTLVCLTMDHGSPLQLTRPLWRSVVWVLALVFNLSASRADLKAGLSTSLLTAGRIDPSFEPGSGIHGELYTVVALPDGK